MNAQPTILTQWFGMMDSSSPERVLNMITDDFRQTILFSNGTDVAEFDGDRASLESYLEQREVSVLTHHILHGGVVGDTEMVVGETRRDGRFEASFNATAQLTTDGSRVRRMLICRSPKIQFSA